MWTIFNDTAINVTNAKAFYIEEMDDGKFGIFARMDDGFNEFPPVALAESDEEETTILISDVCVAEYDTYEAALYAFDHIVEAFDDFIDLPTDEDFAEFVESLKDEYKKSFEDKVVKFKVPEIKAAVEPMVKDAKEAADKLVDSFKKL